MRILVSASRYIQGPAALSKIGEHALVLGKKALLIGGNTALSLCAVSIEQSFEKEGISCCSEPFQGVSTWKEIHRLVAVARNCGADLIIALGGGAALDAGKAVAHELNLPVIVVPTTAATDGPCSALTVIYNDQGGFEQYLSLRHNPECVLVDTEIIARAPVKFLVAGMGDALACYWESATCARSGRTSGFSGGQTPTLAVLTLARLCYETLLESGRSAKLAVEQKLVTPAVEAVVEANTLLSGLSSENAGHAGAHAIHNGLTVLPATQQLLHGEKVAFGLLAQLVLEGQPQQHIRQVQDFCMGVGLPICLEELHLGDVGREDIRLVAQAAVEPGETIHFSWFAVTAEMVEAAIWTADALGRDYRQYSVPVDQG